MGICGGFERPVVSGGVTFGGGGAQTGKKSLGKSAMVVRWAAGLANRGKLEKDRRWLNKKKRKGKASARKYKHSHQVGWSKRIGNGKKL